MTTKKLCKQKNPFIWQFAENIAKCHGTASLSQVGKFTHIAVFDSFFKTHSVEYEYVTDWTLRFISEHSLLIRQTIRSSEEQRNSYQRQSVGYIHIYLYGSDVSFRDRSIRDLRSSND
jgi:hypothetical protein